MLEVKSRRVGGATYQVPVEVRRSAASPWPCAGWSLRERPRREDHGRAPGGRVHGCGERRGNAVKKRDDTHKMAEANKAFAHYRW